MGEAATRKVAEIEEARGRLEADLQELEARMPAPLRSAKALAGTLVAALGGVVVLRRMLSKRSKGSKPTEVVIRVVREDQEPSDS